MNYLIHCDEVVSPFLSNIRQWQTYRFEDELGLTYDSAIRIDPVQICVEHFALHDEVHALSNGSAFNHDSFLVKLEWLHSVEIS